MSDIAIDGYPADADAKTIAAVEAEMQRTIDLVKAATK